MRARALAARAEERLYRERELDELRATWRRLFDDLARVFREDLLADDLTNFDLEEGVDDFADFFFDEVACRVLASAASGKKAKSEIKRAKAVEAALARANLLISKIPSQPVRCQGNKSLRAQSPPTEKNKPAKNDFSGETYSLIEPTRRFQRTSIRVR